MDVPKAEFQRIWNKGYTESFEAKGYKELKQKLPELICLYADPNGTALDIGCGSCQYTCDWLAPVFKHTIGLDVISEPYALKHDLVEFRIIDDRDFDCSSISDDTISFVFSMGCFCHLSNSANQAYLHSIYRVLKPGGHAMLMFANWPNHSDLAQWLESGKTNNREEAGPGWWFYNDIETVTRMTAATGFKTFTDLIPGCRDLVALFSKA